MPSEVPYFQVPLDLPHAGRVARRILVQLDRPQTPVSAAGVTAEELIALLAPYYDSGEDPPAAIAARVRDEAASLGRRLVDDIERDGLGHDRLGQCVRNFFECLELSREGTLISLRAGEDPKSMQRPG